MQVPQPHGGEPVHIWLGNQWNSGLEQTPPGPRHHDLLYWAKLSFNDTGFIQQLRYQDEIAFEMALVDGLQSTMPSPIQRIR